MADCSCGGMGRRHHVGEGDCYRRVVPPSKHPQPLPNGRWLVNGQNITGATLRQQRMYRQHSDGSWSRAEGSPHEISLPEET